MNFGYFLESSILRKKIGQIGVDSNPDLTNNKFKIIPFIDFTICMLFVAILVV